MTFLYLVPNLSFFTKNFNKDFEFDVKLGVGVKISKLTQVGDFSIFGSKSSLLVSKVSFNYVYTFRVHRYCIHMNQYGMNRFTRTEPVPPVQIINYFIFGGFCVFWHLLAKSTRAPVQYGVNRFTPYYLVLINYFFNHESKNLTNYRNL